MFTRLKIVSHYSPVMSKTLWGGGKGSKGCALTTQPIITVMYKPEKLLEPGFVLFGR